MWSDLLVIGRVFSYIERGGVRGFTDKGVSTGRWLPHKQINATLEVCCSLQESLPA
jgi:hypothetical protein